jgi:hypothetical protein
MSDPSETIQRIRAHQRKLLLHKMERKMAHAAVKQTHFMRRIEASEEDFGPDRELRASRAAVLDALDAAKVERYAPRPAGSGRRPSLEGNEVEPVRLSLEDRRNRIARITGVSGAPPPTNVLVNNPTGEAFGDGQCEVDLAVNGSNIVVAWNDGNGFTDLSGDTQGYGYSTNSGSSFTDGGKLPLPVGMPNFIWTSDPIVTVNEGTGEFWYAGLCSPTFGQNGIAVVKGTFAGSIFTWGAPVVVRTVSDTQFFLDKLWMVADS